MSAVVSMPLSVRPAAREDLPAMVAIERASFSDPWSEEAFSTALALDRMRMLVAEESAEHRRREGGDAGRRVVGYVVALAAGAEADIADLAVDPVARRRGIGRLLLERMLAQLAETGVASVFLEVRESNAGARAMYEAGGFTLVGVRRRYYRRPLEDALVLRRDIGTT